MTVKLYEAGDRIEADRRRERMGQRDVEEASRRHKGTKRKEGRV